MKLKFISPIGSAEGWFYPANKPVDFHDDELGAKFIASGIAVAVEEEEPAKKPAVKTAKR